MNQREIITCRLGDATVERKAIRISVPGRALLGPAIFPTWRPETYRNESAQLTAKRGWVIRRRGTRASWETLLR